MNTPALYKTPAMLGAEIRNARKRANLTQAELAFAAGVGMRFLGELEKGKETAQIGKILQVLAALGGSLTLRWNDD